MSYVITGTSKNEEIIDGISKESKMSESKMLHITESNMLHIAELKKSNGNYQQIECLVMEGGGIESISFVGALKVLREKGILQNIKSVAGSSSGALQALFVALKAPIEEIQDLYVNTDFTTLQDTSPLYIKQVFNIFLNYGLDSGSVFVKWLKKNIEKYTGNGEITFEDLYKKTGIEYVVTGTNLNRRKTFFYSELLTPKMKIVDALRISMSIPGYFIPVKVNGEYFIDGGFLNNYPIWYFDDKYDNPRGKILGLKLMSKGEKADSQLYHNVDTISSFKDYVYSMIVNALIQIDRGYIKKDYWARTIPIFATNNVTVLQFTITPAQKKQLIDNCEEEVRKYMS
jgi:predicted acylesterase/phospholipase RssA